MSDRLETLRHRITTIRTPLTVTIWSRDPSDGSTRAASELLALLIDPESLVHVEYQRDALPGVRITLTASHGESPVVFWGTPSGFELEGLVQAMEALGGIGPMLSQEMAEVLGQIPRPLAVDLYVAPT